MRGFDSCYPCFKMFFNLIKSNSRKISKVQAVTRMRRAARRKFISHRRKWFNRRRSLDQFQAFTLSSHRAVVHLVKKRRMVFRRTVAQVKFNVNSLHLLRPGFYLAKPFKAQSFTWQTPDPRTVTLKTLVNYNLTQTEVQNFTNLQVINPLTRTFENILTSKASQWVWSNEYQLGQIHLASNILHRNSNLINKSWFFLNNLTTHVLPTQKSGEWTSELTKSKAVKSDTSQLFTLLRLFRTTSDAKRLTIQARKLRTFISLIPRDLFFKAGIIRISSSLQQLDNLSNILQLRRTALSSRGWSKLSKILGSPTPRTFRFRPRRKIQRSKLQLLKKSNRSLSESKPPFESKSMVTGYQFIARDYRFTANVSVNSLLTKFLYLDTSLSELAKPSRIKLTDSRLIASDLDSAAFSSRRSILSRTNVVPSPVFTYTLKRKLLRILSFHKFSLNVTLWYYNTLVRFIEACSGKKTFIKFNPFIENALAFEDLARCNLWHSRITAFQRLLGPKIFLKESLKILHIAIKFKDPTFFANWIKGMLYRMSFWKYRLLFRYIKYAMRYLFWLHFPRLGFKGLKLRLKGKISVAGNARTRTLLYKIGETGYSKFNNKVISDYSIVNTFTGVLGFKVWFFF